MKVANFILEHNLPITTSDHFTLLIGDVFSDSVCAFVKRRMQDVEQRQPLCSILSAIKESIRKCDLNWVDIIRMMNISSTPWYYRIKFDAYVKLTVLNRTIERKGGIGNDHVILSKITCVTSA